MNLRKSKKKFHLKGKKSKKKFYPKEKSNNLKVNKNEVVEDRGFFELEKEEDREKYINHLAKRNSPDQQKLILKKQFQETMQKNGNLLSTTNFDL